MGASASKPEESQIKKKKKKSNKTGHSTKTTTTNEKSSTTKSNDSKKVNGTTSLYNKRISQKRNEDTKAEPPSTFAVDNNSENGSLRQWKPERVNEWPPKPEKGKEPIPVKAGTVLAAVRAVESNRGSLATVAAAVVTKLKEEDGMASAQPSTTTKSKSSSKVASSTVGGKKKRLESTTAASNKPSKTENKSSSSSVATSKSAAKAKSAVKAKKKKPSKQKPAASIIRESESVDESSSRLDTTVTTELATVPTTASSKDSLLRVDPDVTAGKYRPSTSNNNNNARMSSWAKLLRGEANLLGTSVTTGNVHDQNETRDAMSTLTRSECASETTDRKPAFRGAVHAARLAFRRELGRTHENEDSESNHHNQALVERDGLEDASQGIPMTILRERLSATGNTLLERVKLAVARELEEAAEEVEGNESSSLQIDADLLHLLSFLVTL